MISLRENRFTEVMGAAGEWSFVDSGFGTAQENMAFDGELFRNFEEGKAVFRIYGWEPEAVSAGFSQNIDDIIDRKKCRGDGVATVKRMTGGGVLFHGGEITYSMVLSDEPFKAMTSRETYAVTTAFLVNFYKSLGMEASYWGGNAAPEKKDSSGFCLAGREKYDIVIGGKKIGGSAQKRRRGVIFQHGSIPLDSSFRGAGKYMKRDVSRALSGSVSLSELGVKLSFDDAKKILKKSFEETYGVSFKKEDALATKRLPPWLNKKIDFRSVIPMKKLLSSHGLNTICVESLCPNISECFAQGRATFMILGKVCTRGCLFCGVGGGKPVPADETEALRVAGAVAGLKLRHVVVTSPTRDDLPDGGAGLFAQTVRELRKMLPSVRIELLIPDFAGDEKSLLKVTETRPDIIGHNMETVRKLYHIRKGADYKRSIDVLKKISETGIKAKSGFMLGLGETENGVIELIKDIRRSGCVYLSMGQYLMPGKGSYPVKRYAKPEEFEYYKGVACKEGFEHVESGPYVRSSYMAENYV
ncbi:MAG: lipoyl synthase [Elusimicrobia bacterium]|nr:lipoyl synthase [Elusimicrobiota bacterium]